MRGSRKFCQRGSNFNFFLFFDEGRNDSNTTISGPSTARQRNAIQMVFRWRADGGPILNAGFFTGDPTNIAKKLYIYVIGSGPPVPTSGSTHVYVFIHLHYSIYPQLRLKTKIKVHPWSKHTRK